MPTARAPNLLPAGELRKLLGEQRAGLPGKALPRGGGHPGRSPAAVVRPRTLPLPAVPLAFPSWRFLPLDEGQDVGHPARAAAGAGGGAAGVVQGCGTLRGHG